MIFGVKAESRTLGQGPRSDLKVEGQSCERREQNRGQGFAPGKGVETMPVRTSKNAFP